MLCEWMPAGWCCCKMYRVLQQQRLQQNLVAPAVPVLEQPSIAHCDVSAEHHVHHAAIPGTPCLHCGSPVFVLGALTVFLLCRARAQGTRSARQVAAGAAQFCLQEWHHHIKFAA